MEGSFVTSPNPAPRRRRRPASALGAPTAGSATRDAGRTPHSRTTGTTTRDTNHPTTAGHRDSGRPAQHDTARAAHRDSGRPGQRDGRQGQRGTARPAARDNTPRGGVDGALPAPTVRDEASLPRTFADLDLPAVVIDTLRQQGLTELFPIQATTIPDGLAGRDVLGRGRTGSGKTLAFGLAMLGRLAGGRAAPGRPTGLVLVPTRELAQQVNDALAPHAAALRLRLSTVVGGLSIERQIAGLRQGVDVLIATPGRLEDLIARRACALGDVRVVVLDEADQMSDMGFLPVVTRIMEQVAPDGQRLLFSATLDGDVGKLVRRFMSDPVLHSVDPGTATVETMTHHTMHLDADDKTAVTAEIAAGDSKVIMFVRTKHGADRLAKQLAKVGVRAAALHGGKSQNARTRALDWLKDGELDVLIATNVAARGIHIDGIDLVVNVDPPTEAKDYLHRGGRTARAGNSGTVVTLVLPEQRTEVARMMSSVGITPQTSRVRPGDPHLSAVTGSRPPSGEVIALPAKVAADRAQAAQRAPRPAQSRTPRQGTGVRRSRSGRYS
jgi:superfamily II DNA/RNA helicase